MRLQEFLKTALTEIVAGVAEASDAATAFGGSVGNMRLHGYIKENKIVTNENDLPVVMVDFDIALAEAASTDTKGGIGVYLGAVGIGSQGASHGETSTHSRIKFSVPVVLPSAKG
jgi:PII-like signaling protein